MATSKTKASLKAIIVPKIGLEDSAREKIAEGLTKILANSYALMIKTQNYHWNITGPLFISIHELTEEQYRELFEAVDVLAERIRSLGIKSPGSFTEFKKLASIPEPDSTLNDMDMLQDLTNSHEEIIRNAREVIKVASDNNDEGTADLLIARLEFHEKTAWMLRSFLQKQN